MKYLEKLGLSVENAIKHIIPNSFGLIFDGWTCGTEHYIAIFATWSDGKGNVTTVLLCCGPQDEVDDDDNDEDIDFTAESIGDYIFDELNLVGRNFDNIEFVAGDNCSVNRKLARLLRVPLLGCASHKLNLAVSKLYEGEDDLLDVVQNLMKKLRTLKNSSRLRKVSGYAACLRNDTRWNSVHHSWKRYLLLSPVLTCDNFNDDVTDLLPSVPQHRRIAQVTSDLAKCNEVALMLQKSSVDHYVVRSMFDKLIENFPDMEQYLGANATITTDPLFERAVVKIQSQLENTLTVAESKTVKGYLLAAHKDDDSSGDDETGETGGFAVDIVREAVAKKAKNSRRATKYRSMNHLVTTSNIVERLFSRAKLIMRDQRKLMEPQHLELLLFLRCNKFLWNEVTIDDIIVADDV